MSGTHAKGDGWELCTETFSGGPGGRSESLVVCTTISPGDAVEVFTKGEWVRGEVYSASGVLSSVNGHSTLRIYTVILQDGKKVKVSWKKVRKI